MVEHRCGISLGIPRSVMLKSKEFHAHSCPETHVAASIQKEFWSAMRAQDYDPHTAPSLPWQKRTAASLLQKALGPCVGDAVALMQSWINTPAPSCASGWGESLLWLCMSRCSQLQSSASVVRLLSDAVCNDDKAEPPSPPLHRHHSIRRLYQAPRLDGS